MKKLLLVLLILSCYNDEIGDFVYINERFDLNMEYDKKDFIVEDDENFEFYLVADTHYSATTPVMLYKVDLEEDDKIFILGDITNNSSESEINSLLTDNAQYGYNLYGVMGNRDVDLDFDLWGNLFGPTIYSYHIGETLIIVLDTTDGYFGYRQFKWLEDTLSIEVENKIILNHMPPRSYTDREFERYEEIMQNYDIDVVFHGHDHYYSEKIIGGVLHVGLADLKNGTNKYLIKISIVDNEFSWGIIQ